MPHESVLAGTTMHGLASELAANTGHTLFGDLAPLQEYIDNFAHYPEAYIERSFTQSLLVASNPYPHASPAAYELTRQARAFGEMTGPKAHITKKQLDDIVCLEAEARLCRSLNRHWNRKHPLPSNNYLPAAIIHDIDGEPCGYQKNSGIATTYVWRDSVLSTEAGAYKVPGNSFLALEYDAGSDPRHVFNGIGLIALRKPLPVTGVELLRFSTASLPIIIRRAGQLAVNKREVKLAENEHQAVTFQPRDIEETVATLLKRDHAHIVK